MSEIKIKCCPFCGGEASAFKDKYNRYFTGCNECNFYYGIEIEHDCELEDGWVAVHDSKEEAIAAWNQRKPMDSMVEKLEEEREISYADFTKYVNEYSPCLDDEYDDLFHRGLERAMKIIKDGGSDGEIK